MSDNKHSIPQINYISDPLLLLSTKSIRINAPAPVNWR